jgi:hypothetical protein
MPISDSLSKALKAAGRRARAERLAEEAREREEDREVARRRAAVPPEERARVARAVWAWLEGPEAAALKDEVDKAGLPRLRLLGPVWAESARDADGMRSGTLVFSLVPTETGLHLNYRMGPAWGARDQIRDLELVERYVPYAPLRRLLGLIESGELWEHLEREAQTPQ